jgi:flagellar biosynthesis/type III secretory pathway M-ring protein FliF/YscJ
MGAEEYPYGTLDDGEEFKRILIEKNFEINETRQMINRAQGAIETLNVAATINSDIFDEDYVNAGGDYVTQVKNVLMGGLGITAPNVGVEAMPFIEIDTTLQDLYAQWDAFDAAQRTRELISTIVMWAVVLFLGLSLIMLVRTIVKGGREAQIAEQQAQLALAGGGIDVTVGDEEEDLDTAGLLDELAATPPAEIEMKAKSSDLEAIENFIQKDPASVALLLRNWLSEDT